MYRGLVRGTMYGLCTFYLATADWLGDHYAWWSSKHEEDLNKGPYRKWTQLALWSVLAQGSTNLKTCWKKLPLMYVQYVLSKLAEALPDKGS